ncbi:MAG TPA: guanylate kinase [Gemmatimonadota bacterium]|nr:guanylate kinase [Gemmatimonadota bacterium]
MTTSARLPGVPIVLSGPSGGGKTTVCDALVRRRADVAFSVSATTRAPRPDEVNDRHYRFVDRERFEQMAQAGELLEWAEVHGEMYGTPRDQFEGVRAGRTLLLDIDVQGARDVRRRVPESVLVFLLPPSADSMLARLRKRGSEDEETLRRRMRTALAELDAVGEFDYAVVNEDLEATVDAVEAILEAERRAVTRLGANIVERADALAEALRGALE